MITGVKRKFIEIVDSDDDTTFPENDEAVKTIVINRDDFYHVFRRCQYPNIPDHAWWKWCCDREDDHGGISNVVDSVLTLGEAYNYLIQTRADEASDDPPLADNVLQLTGGELHLTASVFRTSIRPPAVGKRLKN